MHQPAQCHFCGSFSTRLVEQLLVGYGDIVDELRIQVKCHHCEAAGPISLVRASEGEAQIERFRQHALIAWKNTGDKYGRPQYRISQLNRSIDEAAKRMDRPTKSALYAHHLKSMPWLTFYEFSKEFDTLNYKTTQEGVIIKE